jgi:hypothetical protein
MIATVVCYDEGAECYALYLDGKLEFSGDAYHDNISIAIESFIEGMIRAEADIFREDKQLSAKQQDKFAEEGYDVPEEFPNKWIKK